MELAPPSGADESATKQFQHGVSTFSALSANSVVLEASGGAVVGVRSGGWITACAERQMLVGGSCGDCAQPLDPTRAPPDDTRMAPIKLALNAQARSEQ